MSGLQWFMSKSLPRSFLWLAEVILRLDYLCPFSFVQKLFTIIRFCNETVNPGISACLPILIAILPHQLSPVCHETYREH